MLGFLHIELARLTSGGVAGALPHSENAATISDLCPGEHYSIRIVAINSTSFAALSDPLQVRCLLSDGDQSTEKRKRLEATTDDTPQAQAVLVPTITPVKAFGEATSSLVPPLHRESSGSNVPSKRNSVSRQGAQPPQGKSRAGSHGQDGSDNIQVLTSRLDTLRTQLQELQTQDDDEEAEFQASQAELIEQRDDLKQQLKERDDQNKDLNKSVKNLEHLNSAAQSKKTQQEKALNDKLRSRQKMHEDTQRWESEMDSLHAEAEDLKKQQEELVAETKKRVVELKHEQKPSLEALATIDEQIKQKGKEVQELDKERRTLDDAPEQAETMERSRAMAVEEREFTERIAGLHAALHDANAAVVELKGYIQQYESIGTGRRNSLQNGYAPAATTSFEPAIQDVNFSQPQQSTRVNFEVPETRPNHAYSHTRNETSSTGSFRTASPFHTQASYITLPNRAINGSTSPDQAKEMLTGGALVSPSAGALLPSDLLGDDTDDMIKPRLRGLSNSISVHSSSSRPASGMSRPMSTHVGRNSAQSGMDTDSLPGLGTLGDEDLPNDPSSPGASHDSASPSTFSSPHSSFANLHSHKLSDTNTENDRRSIRSASGSNRIIPSSWRFGAFGRQRGSTTSRDDLPALGSLKSNQSQSMPRETDSLPGLGRKPASGIFGFGLGRRAAANAPTDFGAIGTPLRNSGSRPESTYSMDIKSTLPEPSANSPRFGWDVRRSSSTRTGGRKTNPWSPLASRRQSVQHDSSGHLPQVEDNEDEEEDDIDGWQENVPIGSKSGRGKASDKSTQLNPNARDFTSMFGFGKRADKSDKVGSKSKRRHKAPRLDDPDTNGEYPYDSSPADSRKSKDTQSNSFTDSFEDITEEPDNAQGLAILSTAANRGSLMRRITNKGGSAKFLGLKTKKAANLTDEGEEDSGSSSKLGQSVESINSPTPTATQDKRSSTSSFFSSIGRRKKKANEALSISEMSVASETGDEDELRPSTDGGPSA